MSIHKTAYDVTHSSARLPFTAAIAAMMVTGALCAQTSDIDARSITAAIRARNYTEAVSEADALLVLHPDDCPALTLRGIALLHEGMASEARASVEHALQSCPQSLPALEAAAQMDYASHSPTATALLQRILDQRPDDLTAHAMLGSLSFQRDDCAAAIKHFEAGLSLIEQNEEAEREYGSCLFVSGEQAKAEQIFQRMAERDPKEANMLPLAYLQWKAKDAHAALQTLRPLLASPEASSRLFSLAAQIAEEAGDTPHAVEWLRAAIVKNPVNPANYLLFATISFNHASYQVGIDVVNAGLQQVPHSARLFLARGVLQVQLSRLDSAVADFERAHSLDPKLSFVQDAMGMIRSQQHDAAGSLAIFEKQAVEHPQDPLLQYLYAEALSEAEQSGGEENLSRALTAVKKSLELEPGYQPAHDLLCTLLLETKNYAEAVRQADIALKSDPTDQSALYQQMQAERRLGNKDKVAVMVARLNDLKKQEQSRQTQYVLADTDTNHPSQDTSRTP